MITRLDKMKKLFATIFLLVAVWLAATAQTGDIRKMSPLVREASASVSRAAGAKSARPGAVAATLTAFVRATGDAGAVFRDNGCTVLAQFGDIYIAGIPLDHIAALSLCKNVMRIEAGKSCTALMDSTRMHVDALPVYEGIGLPQAYTGKGVVMGVMDIGFDLTHPNFYSPDLSEYRIKRLWDQLSADYDAAGELPVGAEYVTREELLGYGCVRDGRKLSHGTHTLGIAAGSGYDSPYRGMAWESDICIVANATTDDKEFIAEEDLYKYTSATDALGFKYIFDYAGSVGKPCVASFSEGANQDFYGDDQLLCAVLDSLTGPGRIIVASAGNDGEQKTYFRKPAGVESSGTFVLGGGKDVYFLMKSAQPFTIRTVVYSEQPDTVEISSGLPLAAPDSLYADTLQLADGEYRFMLSGYPSCYNLAEDAYEMLITAPRQIGSQTPVSVEIVGKDADVEFYMISGYIVENSRNGKLNAGEYTHSILSPGSAPAVICVGATAYRTGFVNTKGKWHSFNKGTNGERAAYSAVGPTFDGRTKPDVMAPGTNVISSYSSYFLENNPTAWDIDSNVREFLFNGRTYSWTSNAGTSMSTPVVGGAIALWLQAYPQLSPEQAFEVIRKTSRKVQNVSLPVPNNYEGYGEIDVYKGLVEVLRIQASGLDEISGNQPAGVRFSLSGDVLKMSFARPLSHPAAVSVYALNGTLLFHQTVEAGLDAASLSLSPLPSAVYAIQLRSEEPGITGSTLVRK